MIYIETLTSLASLKILVSITQTPSKTQSHNTFQLGILGLLGQLEIDITQPESLIKTGLLGSIKNYISNAGLVQIGKVSIPTIAQAKSQLGIIETFLYLVNGNLKD